MGKKKYTAEQIITKLREAEVLSAKGETIQSTCRHLGITEQTFYRWRKEYGGIRIDQAKRFKGLQGIGATSINYGAMILQQTEHAMEEL